MIKREGQSCEQVSEQAWSGRGCTESKRIAAMGGLTIQVHPLYDLLKLVKKYFIACHMFYFGKCSKYI